MAKATNSKTINQVENNQVIEKFDLEEFLSRDFVRDATLHKILNSQITEQADSWDRVNRNIEDFLDDTMESFNKELRNKVNDLISDDLVMMIKNFDDIQIKKLGIEEDLRSLERQRIQLENKNDIMTQMKKMELKIKINELNHELDSTSKAYIEAYMKGLEETQLPNDLDRLVSEAKSTENVLIKRIEFERTVLDAKLKALDLMSNKIEITDYLRRLINSRLNAREDYADRVIKSSKMKIPVIQAIVK